LQDAGSEVHEYLNCIFVAAKLGENITADLLAFGRKQIGAPRSIDINVIIRNIADILKTLLTEDIDFILQLALRELPVFVDPHQIEQVLINLSTNARDAMPDGGRLVIATDLLELEQQQTGGLVAVPPGRYVRLAITDAGSGIPPENLPLLFEPFFTTKHPQKGTGLGLAIVYNIVKQHSGYLDLVSQAGLGTTCTIYLPLSTDEIEEPAGQATEPPVSPEETSQTILLAEDNELVRISIRMLLNQQGYKVLLAENGQEALDRFQAHRDEIDLIILDVVLPVKNGREVYNVIKRQRQDIKALFISGYTDDIITEKGILDGGLEFLSKPIDKQVFIAKVRNILKNS
jgi:CheY-like chemotaxis protein